MKLPISKKIFVPVSAAFIVVVVIASVFYLGYQRGSAHPKTIIVKGLTNVGDEDATADFGLFWQAWDLLKTTHIKGGEVQDQNLVYGAVEGLTNAFGDPNTNFFRPDDSKKFDEDISGNFGGIGSEIGIQDGELIVVAPLKNSPSERAGIQAGDKIRAIDAEPTVGLSVADAVKKIRGPVGSTVVLSILRAGWKNSQDIPVVRDIITVPAIDWKMLDGNIMHVTIYSFNDNAAIAFTEPAIEALAKGAKGMIIDVRNNPGGFLEVANYLAGWFVKKGEVVVREEFRSDPPRIFRANGNEALLHMPVVMLMNEGSASASEILAGALRDNRGIQLVGTKSFGKGTVQELRELKDGSKLKITIAHWLTPNGTVIDKNGLEPDYKVQFTEADVLAKKDVQLEKAIEVLREEGN